MAPALEPVMPLAYPQMKTPLGAHWILLSHVQSLFQHLHPVRETWFVAKVYKAAMPKFLFQPCPEPHQ